MPRCKNCHGERLTLIATGKVNLWLCESCGFKNVLCTVCNSEVYLAKQEHEYIFVCYVVGHKTDIHSHNDRQLAMFVQGR